MAGVSGRRQGRPPEVRKKCLRKLRGIKDGITHAKVHCAFGSAHQHGKQAGEVGMRSSHSPYCANNIRWRTLSHNHDVAWSGMDVGNLLRAHEATSVAAVVL